MIIDCHCHSGKGDLLTGPWDTDAPIATQKEITPLNDTNRHAAIAPLNFSQNQARSPKSLSQNG
jgi:hypothetical protein